MCAQSAGDVQVMFVVPEPPEAQSSDQEGITVERRKHEREDIMAATIQAHDAQQQKNRPLVFMAIAALAALLMAATYLVRATQPTAQTSSGTAFTPASTTTHGLRFMAAGPAGDMYVTSTQANRIVRIVDGSGPVAFAAVPRPMGIAVDSRGKVYVAESRSCRIQTFSAALQPGTSWTTCAARSEGYDGPSAMAVGADGKIYVTSQASSIIGVYSPKGALLRSIFTGGSRQRFGGIAAGPTGTLYLTDAEMDRILVIPAGSARSEEWGGYGTAPGRFQRPTQIATDARGNIYVLDAGNARIQKLSPAGKPVLSWGHRGSVPVPGSSAMTVDQSGAVYVTGGAGGIQRINPTGHLNGVFG
jgi:sugar lactone lactonase YvrE